MGHRQTPWSRWLFLSSILFALPGSAHAHTTIKGLGDVASGAVHPLTTPAHVLILLGLALLLAQQTPPVWKKPLMLFVPALGIALLLTTIHFIDGVPQPLLLGFALLIAVLVALEIKPPPVARDTLLVLAALGVGLDSVVDTGTGIAVAKTLLGTWVSAPLFLFNLAYYLSLGAQKKWLRVGLRVLGSWIIAITLLVLAFSLRK